MVVDRILKRLPQGSQKFNPNKCVAMSILINGALQKYKITTEQLFTIASGPIKQFMHSEGFRYLSVISAPLGVEKPGRKLYRELDNINNASLKPQQCSKILRCFIVPRCYHLLVLSLCPKKGTSCTRMAIRRWLSLPHDTLLGYFYARCRDGGLGITPFVTSVPGMILDSPLLQQWETRLIILQFSINPLNVQITRHLGSIISPIGVSYPKKQMCQLHM